jgi:hypothetical protein
VTTRLHGVMAEFRSPEALIAAVAAAKDAGYTRLDAFSPFPLKEVADQLGARPAIIPWIAWVTGFIGAAIQYGSQYWMNAVDYPLNVGGRPLHSWPAFIPASLIVAILWAGAATLIGLLLILRLPRLHHPVFTFPGFERASEDRFFLCVMQDDPMFDDATVRAFFGALLPLAIREVPACD